MSRSVAFALAAFLALGSSSFAQGDGHTHAPGDGHDHGAPEQGTPTPAPAPTGPKRLKPIGAEGFQLLAGLWQGRTDAMRTVTLPALMQSLTEAGYVANFAQAAARARGEHKGDAAADAQVYRTLDAIGHALLARKDDALAAQADAWIDTIASAQESDGYLNTLGQSAGDAMHWRDLAAGQELACAGDLFRAAVAYRRGTGKTKLLDVARKLADHVDRKFGPGKLSDPGAHPGIELGLAALYEETGEARYLTLASFFVEQRGRAEGRASHGDPAQDRRPIREQTEVVGDPARAARLYAGAAEVARLANDDTLVKPLQGLFQDLTRYKLHVTGGAAVNPDGTIANLTAPGSAELPIPVGAAIEIAEWAHRMFLLTGDATYADVVDAATNNVVLAASSPKGDTLFDTLPLHAASERARGPVAQSLECAASLARFVMSMSDRTFALGGNTVYVSQYTPCLGEVVVAGVPIRVKMESDWPYAGRVNFELNPSATLTFALKLRRPEWCQEVVYQHDLKEQEHSSKFPGTEAGWEAYERKYEPTDGARAHFLSPVRRVLPPPGVAAWQARTAILRGPLVYALEGLDNRGSARAIVLPQNASLTVRDRAFEALGYVRVFTGKGGLVEGGAGGANTRTIEILLVPYYLTANRGSSDVVVWIPETPAGATPKAN